MFSFLQPYINAANTTQQIGQQFHAAQLAGTIPIAPTSPYYQPLAVYAGPAANLGAAPQTNMATWLVVGAAGLILVLLMRR